MHRPWQAWKALHFATMFKGREHREVTLKKKISLAIALSRRMRHLHRDGLSLQKKDWRKREQCMNVVIKSSNKFKGYSSFTMQAKGFGGCRERPYCVFFFYFKLHEQSLRMQHIPFPCVKEGKAIRPEWQIFLYYRWEDFKQRMKKRTLVDVKGAHQKCSLTESTNTALKYPFPFFTEFSHHFLYQSPTIKQ